MMISISKVVLTISILLTILVALQFQEGESNIFHKKRVFVYITSNITDAQLGVHCREKDNDLGLHNLNFGETYSFSFRPVIFIEAKLYFCGFSWMNELKRFDIYVESRDDKDCKGECRWKIDKSGPCKLKGDDTECFPWKPNNVTEGRQLGEENSTLTM
ncbi:putative plant self-incompatibility S1 [Medicago truncatula]|uniref:S-protein homolog n=2 Tax=Medicago truncatula TaxID=3880 RepID=A0A396JX60_MEDTR|nr:putative plant self-incompatibility S1 [Medicago truncatula]